MEPNSKYPIEEFIMTKNRAYSKGRKIKPTGIQVHSVGCKGTTRDRWRRWNTPSYNKCPNAFIDLNGIMQTLPWDQRPWLSGSGNKGNANDWCVGFEICEPSKAKDTVYAVEYLYGCVVYLCTELCKMFDISPSEIKCHSELHAEGCASNHADVMHWWGKPGTAWANYNMYTLRQDVAKELGVPLAPELKTLLKKGSRGDSVLLLQQMLCKLGYDCGAQNGIFDAKTQAEVKAFQKDYKLAVDGVVGPKTWNALYAETVDDYKEEDTPQEEVADKLYTVIIKHLTDSDATELEHQYEHVTREEEIDDADNGVG